MQADLSLTGLGVACGEGENPSHCSISCWAWIGCQEKLNQKREEAGAGFKKQEPLWLLVKDEWEEWTPPCGRAFTSQEALRWGPSGEEAKRFPQAGLPYSYLAKGQLMFLPALHSFPPLLGLPPCPHSQPMGFTGANVTSGLCGWAQDSDPANQSAPPSRPQDLSRDKYMMKAGPVGTLLRNFLELLEKRYSFLWGCKARRM